MSGDAPLKAPFDWAGERVQRVAGDYIPTRYGGSCKQVYHDAARKVLRTVAKHMGLDKADFEYRRSMGGSAVGGDSILHTDRVYVMVSPGYPHGILARSCKDRKDYCGGPNQWLPWTMMDRPEELAVALARISRKDPIRRPDIRPRARRRAA